MPMKISLAGLWQVTLTHKDPTTLPETYESVISLPGTTSAAGLGEPNPRRETGFLTDAFKFEGHAFFSRTFEAEDWTAQEALLTLERTRMTRVYLDGQFIGSGSSLSTAQRFPLPPLTKGLHTLTICVSNVGYPVPGGHLTSPDTQSNWNGIVGEISLTVARRLLSKVIVQGDVTRSCVHLRGEIQGGYSGVMAVSLPGQMEQLIPYRDGRFSADVPLRGDEALWDEFHPVRHTLTLDLDGDQYEIPFGLRDLRTDGRRLLINGRETFLRGKHDGLVFPLTGAAPMDVDSWMAVLGTAKEYGINHYRFHTCCPPEAAFEAADRLGIYFSPETCFWGTVRDENEPEFDPAAQSYLEEQGFQMLAAYGHHPSFVMMSLGNELWGSKQVLNRMLHGYRAADPTKLYVGGSNNFQWVPTVLDEEDLFVGVRLSGERLIRGSYAMCDAPQGIVQTTAHESHMNYDAFIAPTVASGGSGQAGKVLIQYGTGVKEVDAEAAEAFIPNVPVISHEIGQYGFYPDFSEIDQYVGPLKARNFEVFRERLEKAGLYQEHKAFFRDAGHLAVACYKRELETALRSRELSGFQVLDLQDFPGQGTALVGILNAFMRNKGLVTAAGWREFCAATVVLGEFDSFVFRSSEEIHFAVRVSETDPDKVHTRVRCELLDEGVCRSAVEVTLGERRGRLTDAVPVTLPGVSADCVRAVTVRLTLEDGTVNHYPLEILPRVSVRVDRSGITYEGRHIAFVSYPEDARHAPAIVIPDATGKLPAEYCTDFWNYPMFRAISESMGKPVPVGTMGLSIRREDPLIRRFATATWTTPAWYDVLKTAHCEPIGNVSPIVQMIDNVERCARLGLLYRVDGVLHLTARLWENAESPAVQAFAALLAEAMR